MTKEDFIKLIDIEEGDKIYFIKIGKKGVHRLVHGFYAAELIGHLELIIDDIKAQVRGESKKPNIIKKEVVE